MGKKGKNKLDKMSEEERARFLQHKADMEEEAKRRKEQLIAMYMKNKLKREDAFARLNLAKINQEWRFILRQVKCKEMRTEIENMERLFTDCIERKNRIIRRLLSELDESEEIYSTMLHTHMENIENLIGIHSNRLNFIRKWYVDEKNGFLDQNKNEVTDYENKQNKSQVELECILYGLEEGADKRKQFKEDEHTRKMDELKNTMIIKLEQVTNDRENEMAEYWREFQNILNEYLRHTEQYRNEYIDIRQRDTDETRSIKIHYLEVAKTTELISELKQKLETMKEEHEFGIKELGKYKKDMQEKHTALKNELECGLSKDRENLKVLVINSEMTLKKLNYLVKIGENILNISSNCRKIETEEEKVLPFSKPKILFEHSEEEFKSVPEEFKEDTDFLLFHFENFWCRYNRAKIDCASLNEEKLCLKDENRRLKEKLKNYLTSVTVITGNEANIRPSSMKIDKIVHIDLTINSKDLKEKKKKRPITCCIEGNLSVAVRSQKLLMGKLQQI